MLRFILATVLPFPLFYVNFSTPTPSEGATKLSHPGPGRKCSVFLPHAPPLAFPFYFPHTHTAGHTQILVCVSVFFIARQFVFKRPTEDALYSLLQISEVMANMLDWANRFDRFPPCSSVQFKGLGPVRGPLPLPSTRDVFTRKSPGKKRKSSTPIRLEPP